MQKWYKATELAGDWIAGKRRPDGGRIKLTDEQASYDLLRGAITLDEPVAKPGRKEPADVAKK